MVASFRPFLFALALAASVAVPAALGSSRDEAPTGAGPTAPAAAGLPAAAARELHRVLHGLLERAVTRANRSERLKLRIGASLVDDQGRMLLDLQGTARVRVPLAALRESLAARAAARESWVVTTNGAIALDLALTPMKVEGEEATFAFQADLTLLMRPVLEELVRTGACIAGSVAMAGVAAKAIEVLRGLDADVLGKGLALGVQELSALMGGEGAARAFAGVTDSVRRGWIERFRGSLGFVGILRHLLVGILVSGTSAASTLVGTSLGSALGATLLPSGGAFVVGLAATTAAFWFGSWAIHAVTVKLPVAWKFSKLEKLHARSDSGSEGSAWQIHGARLAATLAAEIDGSGHRWPVLELLIERVRAVRQAGGKQALAAYRPVTDEARKRLAHQAAGGGNFYAARIYYQLLGALDDLPPK